MKRIGIGASKIAKGNIALYNFYVIVFSSLISLFIFIIAGVSILLSLLVVRYLGYELNFLTSDDQWQSVFGICMAVLTAVVSLFMLLAIIGNVKIFKRRINGFNGYKRKSN